VCWQSTRDKEIMYSLYVIGIGLVGGVVDIVRHGTNLPLLHGLNLRFVSFLRAHDVERGKSIFAKDIRNRCEVKRG
jgi:hypothetical protein